MEKYSIVLMFFLHAFFVQAQNCREQFIIETVKTLSVKNSKFNKMAYKQVGYKDVKLINIPVMFISKEGAKLNKRGALEKENLMCFLNTDKLLFYESYVFSDSIYIGIVTRNLDYNTSKNALSFEKNTLYADATGTLADKINQLNPDYIFRIYNLPECYWFIKNNQLFVLHYKHEEKGDNKIVDIKDFISNYISNEDVLFLSPKRVEVVSGR